MIHAGLVITLTDDVLLRTETICQLGEHADVTLGKPQASWLPISLETTDQDGARAFHRWAEQLKGVRAIDVVSIEFESN